MNVAADVKPMSPQGAVKSGVQRRVHSVARDIGITAATEVATLIAGLVIISLFGRFMGPLLLAEYMVARRVVAWFQSGVQLGLGIALPRYVARVQETDGEHEAYFIAELCCVLSAALALGIVLCAAPGHFAAWLFGNSRLEYLIPAISLFVVALVLHSGVYGYHRGRLQMGTANSLQLLDSALIPLVIVVALSRQRSVALTVSSIAFAVLVCASLFGLRIVARRSKRNPLRIRHHASVLLKYGVPRVPGEFSESALLAIGPLFLTRYVPLSEITYMLLGTSMLMITAVSVAPLGIVLLSKLSSMLAENRLAEIRAPLQHLLAAIVEISTFACLQIVIFADVLLNLWVGPAYSQHIRVVRILCVAAPFYVFFVSLRSVTDAASPRPYNARNTITTLVVLLLLLGVATILPSPLILDATAFALATALVVLAFLTSRTVEQLYSVKIPWRKSIKVMLVAAGLGGVSLVVRLLSGPRMGISEFALIQIVVATLFLFAVRRNGSEWFGYMSGLIPAFASRRGGPDTPTKTS